MKTQQKKEGMDYFVEKYYEKLYGHRKFGKIRKYLLKSLLRKQIINELEK